MTDAPLQIETARLILRRWRIEDAGAVYQYRSHPSVTQFQPWRPENVAEVAALIESRLAVQPQDPDVWLQLAITLKDSKTIIGDCSMYFLSDAPRQAELGFNLAPAYRGKGYATEAVSGVLQYLFEPLQMHRVFVRTDPENRPAAALLERLHMRQEGHFLRNYWLRDRWTDEVLYAMLEDEWDTLKPEHG